LVAGSDQLSIMAGTYTVRIELVAGGRTRVDYLYYAVLPNSGVEDEAPTTWGRLKALYR
jgi:hypothetical protein